MTPSIQFTGGFGGAPSSDSSLLASSSEFLERLSSRLWPTQAERLEVQRPQYFFQNVFQLTLIGFGCNLFGVAAVRLKSILVTFSSFLDPEVSKTHDFLAVGFEPARLGDLSKSGIRFFCAFRCSGTHIFFENQKNNRGQDQAMFKSSRVFCKSRSKKIGNNKKLYLVKPRAPSV